MTERASFEARERERLRRQPPRIVATFRDPDGTCFSMRQRTLRLVYRHAVPRMGFLLSSDFFRQLTAERCVPATEILKAEDLLPTSTGEFDLRGALESGGMLLEHERIDFPSYPHEWPPRMLFAAAQFTLDLQLRALEAGFTLKDATPGNVLFRGPNPVFVDVLSFQIREKGALLWPAYAQFVRTFLLPLLLHRRRGVFVHGLFLDRADGLEPEEVYAQLSWAERWSPLALRHVSIPTWFRHTTPPAILPSGAKSSGGDAKAKEVGKMLIRGLRRSLADVRPAGGSRSTWSGYEKENTYSPAALAAKAEFVHAEMAEMKPRRVIDVGCNTGQYSLIAARLGASVVAIDSDPVVVDDLWKASREQGIDILPLVVNFARPSPPLGWRNAEAAGFLERARGQFDVGLMLAVIHHLSVGSGVPLREIFEVAADLVRVGLIVEFVPPADAMFQRLARNKEHLIPRLQRLEFEQAFASSFDCARAQQLPECGRILYSLRRRPLEASEPGLPREMDADSAPTAGARPS